MFKVSQVKITVAGGRTVPGAEEDNVIDNIGMCQRQGLEQHTKVSHSL
jgi:hypothetical protein